MVQDRDQCSTLLKLRQTGEHITSLDIEWYHIYCKPAKEETSGRENLANAARRWRSSLSAYVSLLKLCVPMII
jgi:hypothetical protein